ncbi:MAG: 4-hydroxy-3-methylbut-2-enyl diphosphate reductase [candidate division WOR-3 bacterium]|nr:4-hydroxy-3-methylbut-2-enyl diphosphate reductase [candidate division WOR-3 bacterium]
MQIAENKPQMTIHIAEPTGFCFGVKRAIHLALQGLKTRPQAQNKGIVYTLGPIIHNQSVVNQLRQSGIKTAPNLSYLKRIKPAQRKTSVVVIRSHGVAPGVINRIEKLGYKIIDATCPYVKRIQNIALKLKKENFLTVIIGDKRHPEVKGILGYAQPFSIVFSKNQDLFRIIRQAQNCGRKIGVVGQTTLPIEYFQKAVKILNNTDKLQEIRVYNTLCKEALTRQRLCQKLSRSSDIMIVVGGKNSANTQHLVEIAQKFCPRVYQVAEPEEINPNWFKDLGGVSYNKFTQTYKAPLYFKKPQERQRVNSPSYKNSGHIDQLKVGVVAGTSTPCELVLAIVDKIKTSGTSEIYTLAKVAKTTAKEALDDYGK